tara:strand:- start:23672 stop:24568 length:897 start_codon:yes stop_codon:yes gene_type:complete
MQEIIIKTELTSTEGPLAHQSIKTIIPVAGGCIHKAWQIELKNGHKLFAKTTSKENFSMLQFEANCLKLLNQYANHNLLKIPEPLAIQKLQKLSILLMPWIEFKNGDQTNLGKGLALLHQNSASAGNKNFGWENEGFIGSEIQKGGWGSRWGKFFVEFRLVPQIKKGRHWGLSLSHYKDLLEKLIIFLDKHDPKPSLVHGDLWSGNSGVDESSKGIIFDPASWWADREVDIAMTRLFGGFSRSFYEGYNEIWPLSNCSKERIDIYNLYHLLNHANIFGGHYKKQSLDGLNKIDLKLKF